MVGPLGAQLADGDRVLGPGEEGKAEVPGGTYQSAFIGRGRLVAELTWQTRQERKTRLRAHAQASLLRFTSGARVCVLGSPKRPQENTSLILKEYANINTFQTWKFYF